MDSGHILAQFVFDNIRTILILWVSVNTCALILYFVDKRKAELNDWRISESTLLRVGFVAPVGALIGMRIFRHKTRKLRFRLLIPLFLIAHLAFVSWLIFHVST